MKLIIGLGNPGSKYALTRHNTGFRAVDILAIQIEWQEAKKFQAVLAQTTIAGQKVLLAKPQTYMNKSGEAVRKIVSFYKIALDDILIIYDDIDLLVGQTRWREKGGSGSHNGMQSVIDALGSKNISRLRVGIAEKTAGKQTIPAADYVLKNFSKKAEEKIKKTLANMPEIVMILFSKACLQCKGKRDKRVCP